MSNETDLAPILKLRHVRRRFLLGETTIDALHDISLDIHAGEFLAVWGPSGSGKTTLMNIIGLIDSPTEGEVLFEEQDTRILADNALTEFRADKIGFVFQSFNLIDELTVEENIELPLTYLNIPKAERKTKVEAIMKRMAISHRAKHFPHQLSGGQQQRVAIARAVVFGPKLILADEPTGNLDSKNGAEVMHLLTELNHEGTTIVMVTHNEHDAKIAHRTIRLFDGQIVEAEGNQL